MSDSSGSTIRLGAIGSGLPAMNGQTIGQIQKYSLVSGNWTATGTVSAIRGLTAEVVGNNVTLFGTTGGSAAAGGGSIYSFTDTTGYNGTISGSATTIATAATDEAFRGIAFVPTSVPEPGVIGLLGGAAVLLATRRRK